MKEYWDFEEIQFLWIIKNVLKIFHIIVKYSSHLKNYFKELENRKFLIKTAKNFVQENSFYHQSFWTKNDKFPTKFLKISRFSRIS